MTIKSFQSRAAMMLLGAAILTACNNDRNELTGPTRSVAPGSARHEQDPNPNTDPFVFVCALSGPAGTYGFHIDVTGAGNMLLVNGPDATVTFDGTNEACVMMAQSINPVTWQLGSSDNVTITQTIVPAGVKLDSIQVYNSTLETLEPAVPGVTSLSHSYHLGDQIYFGFRYTSGAAQPGSVQACQSSGPAGNYTFHVDVTGGGTYTLPNGSNKTVAFNGTTPACVTMYTPTAGASWTGATATVKLTEVLTPFGADPKAIIVTKNGTAQAPVNNVFSVTVPVGLTDVVSASFTTTPWQLGLQGCTSTYWKGHPNPWTATGYSQSQLISSVLNVPSSLTLNGKTLGSYTLIQGLNFTGGTTTSGAAQSLIRSTIAALLNAASPTVAYASPTSVIRPAAELALASNSAWIMNTLAAASDILNNGRAGCPLN